ncbi:hypothetical protein [Pseudomonas sp. Marseille-QA0892]
MLSSEQQAALASAICATAEALGQTISPTTARIFAQDLVKYPAEEIRSALLACRRTLTGRLTLAAIQQQLYELDGRPEPNEAWAIAVIAVDEENSVVLTEEILLALGVARPVLSTGDPVGARMTFLSTYQRLVANSRSQVAPVKWLLSQGYAADRRQMAISDAVRLGRIEPTIAGRLALQLAHTPESHAQLFGPLTKTDSLTSLQPNHDASRHLESLLKILKKPKTLRAFQQ